MNKDRNLHIFDCIMAAVMLLLFITSGGSAESAPTALATTAPIADSGGVAFPMIDLTPYFLALIGLLSVLVTARVVPWLKAKLTQQQLDTLQNWTEILTGAAEQLYNSGKIQDRLKYVTDRLKEKGLTVDMSVIENAVGDINWYNRAVSDYTIETTVEETIEKTVGE